MTDEAKEVALTIEEKKYNDHWESCCVVVDRRAVQYFAQMLIIIGIGGFCIAKLNDDISCDEQRSYLGLLTLLIGLVIPNPKFAGRSS